MKMKQLERVPLERLLAELRARGGRSLADVDLRRASSQQILLAVKSLSAKVLAAPLSIHNGYDLKPLGAVTDTEVLKDMKSVALICYPEDTPADGPLRIVTKRCGDHYPLCHGAPFMNNRIVVNARSGVLVAPRLLATAAHALPQDALGLARVVFGFTEADIVKNVLRVPASRVFRVAREVHRSTTRDWVIVELNRVVEDVTIRPIRREGKIGDGRMVHMIGHPLGMVAQYAANAYVRNNSDPAEFTSDVDTLEGNSGSPIFDAETHQIEGIFYAGRDDWLVKSTCNEYSADELVDGERAVRITELKDHVP